MSISGGSNLTKYIVGLFLALVLCAPAYGQWVASPGGRSDCPGGTCPTEAPSQYQDASVPEWAVKATVKVNDWHGRTASGGTGTIVSFDPETKTCLVLTCRHVVGLDYGKIECVTWDGYRCPAKFVGVHEMAEPRGADITVLEIESKYVDTFVPVATKPLQRGESVCQVGWGGGRLNKRTGRYLGDDSFSRGGWRFHKNGETNFPAVSGDSGSGIFSAERKELVGVLWGGGRGTSVFCGAEYAQQAIELCHKRRKPKEPSVPVQPEKPAKPDTPQPPGGTPVKPDPPKPSTEFNEIKISINAVATAVAQTNDAVKATSKAVADVAVKVGQIDERVAKLEAAKPIPPAPACACDDKKIDKLQADMDKLRLALSQKGTLRFKVEQK